MELVVTTNPIIMSLALHPWTIYVLFCLIVCLFLCCVMHILYLTLSDINQNATPMSLQKNTSDKSVRPSITQILNS